jgi:hypothetical protein
VPSVETFVTLRQEFHTYPELSREETRTVAVPAHSPSYGPAASALLNCGRSSKKAAEVTMSGTFIAKLSLLSRVRLWPKATPIRKDRNASAY